MYQPREDPMWHQISGNGVQYFLCLVVTILNFERELNRLPFFLEKI